MNFRYVLPLAVLVVLACVAAFFLRTDHPMAPPPSTSEKPAKADVTLIAFGDSLTAGYGLQANESFPAQLQMALRARGHKVDVINAGVSGDTTADGLARLDWTLSTPADGIILELGANDALRGIDPKEARANLDKMLATLKAKGMKVLLAGMRAPGNWGTDYEKSFDAIYPDLASKYGVMLYPFFLDGAVIDPKVLLSDGLHPTAAGVGEIVKRILPDVESLLHRIAEKRPSSNS